MHLQSRIYGKSGVGEGSWLEAQLQEAQMAVPRQKGQKKHSSVVLSPSQTSVLQSRRPEAGCVLGACFSNWCPWILSVCLSNADNADQVLAVCRPLLSALYT